MRAEDSLQIRCKKWLATALPHEVVWSGIEHAQQLSLRQGAIRKAKGVRRGLPDFLFWHAGRSIAVELKTPTGVQSESQKEFMERFRAAGGIYAVCRSEQEVERALRDANVPLHWPAPAPWISQGTAPKPKRTSRPHRRDSPAAVRAAVRMAQKGLL